MAKKSIVLYLHVHQPWRVRDDQTIFNVGKNRDYFSEEKGLKRQSNGEIFRKVAEKSYIPMNNLLEKLLVRHPEFKFSFSITGTFIDQAQQFAPDVLESFKRLVRTGRAEIVAETYYHSLAFFFDREEFEAQVRTHQAKIREVFGVETTSFRNTELSYNDELGKWADDFGFKAILTEGWDPVLGWRSPNFVYKPKNTKNIRLLLKNYKLSDDLAFRFSNQNWEEYPLTTEKYISWLESASYRGDIINLFMDYETFGEHQWKRDLTAWLGNSMQQEAMKYLYALTPRVYNSYNGALVEDWRRLTTSDHPYYMCTKYFNDGDVHAYFSPYKSPYDAFLYFMDALRDMDFRLKDVSPLQPKKVQETQKILKKSFSKVPKTPKRKKIFARMLHKNLMFAKGKRG